MARKPANEPPPLELPKPPRVLNWRGSVKPGRRPTREGTWVEHRKRPTHDTRNPVFVTVMVKPDVPDLTLRSAAEAIFAGIEHAAKSNFKKQKVRRRTFRVVVFAIRSSRLELVVEATSADALSRGMQGLSSGLARRVNNQIGREGSLFLDRYDSRELVKRADLKKVLEHMQGDGVPLAPMSEPHTKLLQETLKTNT